MRWFPMAINRKQLIQEINQILTTEGFQTSNIYNQSCFDMLARRQLILLLMKVLVNIDSVNESHVEEIRKISKVFLASPILVGLKTRNNILEEDVVYERHGIPAVNINTFKNMIINDEYPEILADRGGYFVNINGNVLKKCRKDYLLSLKDLADLAHVSRETIYNYENGKVKANIETAMILEEVLNTKITLDIDLFEPYKNNEKIETEENNDLAKLGYGVVSTKKSPFDAVAKANNKKEENRLIADLEKNRNIKTLKKMAIPLKDLSLITSANPFFIIKNDKFKESINGIPVIKSWELKEADDSSKFLKLVKERANN